MGKLRYHADCLRFLHYLSVTPSKTGHMFQPEQRLVTLSSSNIAAKQRGLYRQFHDTHLGVYQIPKHCLPCSRSHYLPERFCGRSSYNHQQRWILLLEVEHGTSCVVSVSYKQPDLQPGLEPGRCDVSEEWYQF